MEKQTGYDVIVVGSGSGGGVLATRLAEHDLSVFLIEAGPDYPRVEDLPDDLLYGYATGPRLSVSEKHMWPYIARATDTAPPMSIPRGRVTGGSSAVNGQMYLRGIPEDYDAWASAGNDLWSYRDVLPYLVMIENDHDFASSSHSQDGPIGVRRYPKDTWVATQQAFFDACRSAGYPEFVDVNDPEASTGVGPYAFNNPGGIRVSTALGYVARVRERPNFELSPNSTAHRVVFDGDKAVGVEYEREGEVHRVHADDVVLCGGAVETPHLLMLSGIGPVDQLEPLGIPVVEALPGVGQNLRDHPMIQLHWRVAQEHALKPRAPRAQVVLRWTAEGSELRDDMWITPLGYEDELMMCCGINLAAGSGELRTVSTDPTVHPMLDYRYLETESDRRRMREATRVGLQLAKDRAFANVLTSRLSPSDTEVGSEDELNAWMQRTVTSSQHISCTAKMGPASDPMAVVDQRGVVRGVRNLRIADASIMPNIVRANTNVVSMMIGERIADFMVTDRSTGPQRSAALS